MKKSCPPYLRYLPLLGVLASGCASAQAKAVPDAPPLNMPAPPPREIIAMEVEQPPPETPAEEPAKPQQPPKPRPSPPRADAQKPEGPIAEPAPPVEQPAKPAAPTTLATSPASAEGELERAIREALSRASADLARVDYGALNPDGKSQYDTAKRFTQQAEDAVRAKNLVFARNLADKAATLAAQLASRR